MSLFSNIITWALRAAQSQPGKQLALEAVGEGADILGRAIRQHAPDVSEDAMRHLSSAISIAVAGVMTKAK